ncbi:SoxR reducing system RseC family protein [Marinobacterium jannaschii]|uniref:SoxR reducing system RseC family protein n=1 Tax=Marinobacterium jannaschii TaxID=64970 RepID=UPI00048025D0|nr:SoxR reducing system RseC family protein [Marinobacterium jannaschii]
MLEESGRVIEVSGDEIWVETVRQSACSSCSARNSCGQKLLASVGQGKRFVVRVDNPDGHQVQQDDSVVIGVSEGSFMKASLLLYTLPLLMLILVALVLDSLGLGEPVVILGSAAGLGGGFLLVRLLSRRLARSCSYLPVLLRVV